MQIQMYNKLTKYFDICIIATQWLEQWLKKKFIDWLFYKHKISVYYS